MELLEVLSRLAVCCVLVTSGAAKAVAPAAARSTVAAFGTPGALVRPVAVLLPITELLLGFAILPERTARPAAAGALALFVTFTVLVVVNLVRGNRPDCQCFGRVASAPINGRTVVRNVVLVALAAVPVLVEPVGLVAYARGRRPVDVLLLVVAAVAITLALVLGDLVASRVRRRTAASSPLAGLVLYDDAGRAVPVSDLLDGRRHVLLVFLSPGCGSCTALAPSVRSWIDAFADVVRVVPVVADSGRSDGAETFGPAVMLDRGRAVRSALGVGSSPSAALIGRDGRLIGDVAGGTAGVRALLSVALADVDAHPRTSTGPVALAPESVVHRRRTVTETGHHLDPRSTVLTEETTGEVLSLDPIGTLIWRCVDGRSSVRETVDDLAAVFGTDPTLIRDEVVEVVSELSRRGFVTTAAAPGRQRGVPTHSTP